MASILRIDTLQNLAGTTAATLDGNGMLTIAQRFRLPQFAFASLPSSGQSEGELVYDTTNKMLRFGHVTFHVINTLLFGQFCSRNFTL